MHVEHIRCVHRYLNQCICAANYKAWLCLVATLCLKSGVEFFLGSLYIYQARGSSISCGLVVWSMTLQAALWAFSAQLLWTQWVLRQLQRKTGTFVSMLTWWGLEFDDGRHADLTELVLRRWLSHCVRKHEHEEGPVVRIGKSMSAYNGKEEPPLRLSNAYDDGLDAAQNPVRAQTQRAFFNLKNNYQMQLLLSTESDRSQTRGRAYGFKGLLSRMAGVQQEELRQPIGAPPLFPPTSIGTLVGRPQV